MSLAVWQAYRKHYLFTFAREAGDALDAFLDNHQSRQSARAGIWQRYTAALTLIKRDISIVRTKMIEKWLKLYYNERIYLEKR